MPRQNFTTKWLDAVRVTDTERVAYWDADFHDRGSFGIRVTRSGVKSWIYLYSPKGGQGKQRRFTIGTYPSISLSDARRKARELSGHSQGGTIDPSACPTVLDLIEEYLENYAKRKKRSWKKDERILKKDFAHRYGHLLAKDITATHIHEILDSICNRGSGTMANRTLEIIRKVFNYALERPETGINCNPCERISKPTMETRRDRVLNSDEICAVWESFDKEPFLTSNIFKLMFLTAQRVGEVCKIRREDIDFKERLWTIPAHYAKNKKSHRVPLNDKAIATIKEVLEFQLKENKLSPWLFPSPKEGQPIQYIHKAAARVRINSKVDFIPHDLRRTATTGMASLGIPSFIFAKVINHTDRSVTAIYDRYSYDKEKRAALEKWEDRLDIILNADKNQAGGLPSF